VPLISLAGHTAVKRPILKSAVWDGEVIPFDSLLMHEYGQHTGADAQATLTDSNASFGVDSYNTGFTLRNTSKGIADQDDSWIAETAVITDTTDTTLVGVLTNSATWDKGNYYEVIVAGLEVGDIIHYESTTNLGGVVTISVKGVVSILGISGTHTFDYWLEDISDGNSLSPVYTYTAVVI
jgi:hypothetical protein